MAHLKSQPTSPDSITSPSGFITQSINKKLVIQKYKELRFGERDAFEDGQNDEAKEAIAAEKNRIGQVLEEFKRTKPKTKLLENVREAFLEWRKEREQKLRKLKKDEGAWRSADEKRKSQVEAFLSQEIDDRHKKPRVVENETKKVTEPLNEFKAGVMHFERTCDEKGRPVWRGTTDDDKQYSAKFPDQKISMNDLLYGDKAQNPFKREKDKIKYIHIPANHMQWIQKAVERYYEEDVQDNSKQKTNQLLSREYWRGQLHGGGLGRTQVHARHMRPRCSHITLDTGSGMMTQKKEDSNLHQSTTSESHDNIKTPPNFALFLPYLHWETNRRRKKLAEVVQDVTQTKSKSNNDHHAFLKLTLPQEPGLISLVELEQKKKKKKGRHNKFDRSNIPSKLGRYLYHLAQACETMNCDADERLIRHGLSRKDGKLDLPLHIRRTLDQFYFLTLADTSRRDTDQVVYRQTQTRIENYQSEDDSSDEEEPLSHLNECRLFHPLRHLKKGTERKPGCECPSGGKAESDKKSKVMAKLEGNTRVVMVDQLWMWILDENTIITSFPRRWGVNKHDSSGVHKSLRETLAKKQEIRSIYHLALLIIDQCSRVFFDRTQPTDDRPEVMDLFAQAIGTVTDNTTSAYELFWNNVKLQSCAVHDEGDKMQARRYLNINPEGVLLREAHDISEELHIMAQIFKQQQNVVKEFRKYMESHRAEFDHQPQSDHTPTSSKVRDQTWRAYIREADDAIEKIKNREIEIDELKGAVSRTTLQLQELLALKQQQASIVEARASLDSANETVKQGCAIMAFTVVTILFAPLGFLAGVFGMNNKNSTDNPWMTLKEQIMYMVILSAVVVFVSLSMAFVTRGDLKKLSWNSINSSSKFVHLHYKAVRVKMGSRPTVPRKRDTKIEQTELQVQSEEVDSKATGASSNEQADFIENSSQSTESDKRFNFLRRKMRRIGDFERGQDHP